MPFAMREQAARVPRRPSIFPVALHAVTERGVIAQKGQVELTMDPARLPRPGAQAVFSPGATRRHGSRVGLQ